MSLLTLTATLLKRPTELVEQAEDRAVFAELVPRLLLLTALGAAIFGGVVGAYRGGIQVVFAAVKLPMLFVVPLIVALPAVRAIAEAAGAPVTWARLVLSALTGVARTAVIAAALSPGLWLMFTWTFSHRTGEVFHLVDYHSAVLVFAAAVLAVGLPLLSTVAGALPARGLRRVVAMTAASAVLGVTLMQTGWLLRPFVVRPSAEVTFLRPLEEDIFSALAYTTGNALDVVDSSRTSWNPQPSGVLRERRTR